MSSALVFSGFPACDFFADWNVCVTYGFPVRVFSLADWKSAPRRWHLPSDVSPRRFLSPGRASFFRAFGRRCCFGQSDREYTIVQARLSFLRLNECGKLELAVDVPIAKLAAMNAHVLSAFLRLSLSQQNQTSTVNPHLNILTSNPRHTKLHHKSMGVLLQMHLRFPDELTLCSEPIVQFLTGSVSTLNSQLVRSHGDLFAQPVMVP